MYHELQRKRGFINKSVPGNQFTDYKGVDFESAERSILDLITDDCEACNASAFVTEEVMSLIKHDCRLYLNMVKGDMNKTKSSQQAKDLADKMKDDDKAVKDLIDSVFTGLVPDDFSETTGLVYSPDLCRVYDICEKCPYYLKSRVCIVALKYEFDSEENYWSLIFDERFNLSSSKRLIKLIINILHLMLKNSDSMQDLLRFKCLLEDIQLLMSVYKLMNPTGEIITSQEDDLIDMLTRDRQYIDEDRKEFLDSILLSVMDDIENSQLPYVKEIQKGIMEMRSERDKGYLPQDYYLSMKSTSQVRSSKKLKSLMNSIFERDTYKESPEVKEFDSFTGYQSYYLDETETIDCPIKTLMIQNPGKFKMRGIHIAENAIQDRCNFIHRCIKQGLKKMVTDCSHDQNKGRSFAKLATLEWSVSDSDTKQGIYCLDFSNATDTMDQEFQNKVLEFCLGPQISNYWGFISQSPKSFYRNSGEVIKFTQKTGQPQGLLGSFDCFSIAHHFMMLMTMKICGLDKYSSTEFYRILGDDSIITTIEPEYQLEDFVLETYKEVCLYANFIVNDDKGIYTHYTSSYASASFAKVDYVNGMNFSPTPFRLATLYSSTDVVQSESGHLGVISWRCTVGYPGTQDFLTSSLKHFYDGKWIEFIIRNGIVPCMEDLKTQSNITDSQLGRFSYCYAISVIGSTLTSMLMNDKELSFSNPRESSSFDDLFNQLDYEQLNKLDMNHKIFSVLEYNDRADQFYKSVLFEDDIDDKVLNIAANLIDRGLSIRDDSIVNLYDLIQTWRILRLAQSTVDYDVSTVFPEAAKGLYNFIKEVKLGLMTRGLTKKPSRVSYILQNTVKLYKELNDLLGTLREDEEFFSLEESEDKSNIIAS